jgi:hypothetical protein
MKALFAIAALSLVACVADAETSDPALADLGPAGKTPAGDKPLVGPPPSGRGSAASDSDLARATDSIVGNKINPAGFVCHKGAFCEDFEAGGYGNRWTGEFTTGGGTIEASTDSASVGSGSLRLFAQDERASAYLLQDKGDVGSEWSGAFGFAFRVDQLPGKDLGLSEVTVKTDDGPITLRVSVRPEGLVLEQIATADCRRDRCSASTKVIAPAKANHWYRVQIGVEIAPNSAPPYGHVDAKVDDVAIVGTDLTVPFYSGSVFMSAGITKGDLVNRATVDLDDVSLLVR